MLEQLDLWKLVPVAKIWFSFVLSVFIIFKIFQYAYRIFLHPLSKVPGPRLAISSLYGAYFDLFQNGGFCKYIAKLHDMYGPVVRISPNEVHVKDMASYSQVFSVGTQFSKPWEYYHSRTIEGSLLNVLDTPSAKRRRAVYGRRFSKEEVWSNEKMLLENIEKFVQRLKEEGRQRKPVNMSFGYKCLTSDIIMAFAFHENFGGLEAQNFLHPTILAMDNLFIFSLWGMYFPNFYDAIDTLIDQLPRRLMNVCAPAMIDFGAFIKSRSRLAKSVKQSRKAENGIYSDKTVYDLLLNSSTKRQEKPLDDSILAAEASLMFLAGTDTTANALAVGTFNILSSPKIYDRLYKELKEAQQAHGDDFLTTAVLQNLPYLNAVIKESLRLSYGAPGRLPRIVPASGHEVAGYHLPAGTYVSHSAYVYHNDEEIFPDNNTFEPERWLKGDTTEMERSIANLELLLIYARVFSELNMTLYKTTAKDMEWGDYAVQVFKGKLKVMVEMDKEDN
ncbi:MAG: hypothetical protein Q9227_006498 [Pyrenula ochraceoflavens]